MNSSLVQHSLQGRRSALTSLLGLSAGAIAGASALGAATSAQAAAARHGARRPGASPPLDFSNPIDNLYAFGKIWSAYDNPIVGAFHGIIYMRMPGRRLVPVFGFSGTGCTQARFDAAGFLDIKSRETGLFTDLRTGEVLEYWDNPLTGERCEVYHFYNNMNGGRLTTEIPKFVVGGAGDSPTTMNEGTVFAEPDGRNPFRLPFMPFGDDLLLQWDYAHEYSNPVTPEGWPSYSTGPRITPSEHFQIYASRHEIEDRSLPFAKMRAGFSRMSECWPWMRMGKHEQRGLTLFGRMHSHKGLDSHSDVAPKVLAYLEKHAPDYLTLPDGWPKANSRLETWGAFAMDVPPETPGYEWKAKARRPAGFAGPPTGLGRHSYP